MVTLRDFCIKQIDEEKKVNEYILHEKWFIKNNILYLESCKGKWKSPITGYEDRLFFIRINESERFPITHNQQMLLMEKILLNDLYPHIAVQNIEKFLNKLYEIKGKIKQKFGNSNIKLPNFNYNLWNCNKKEV